jgi:hypothetical protein
MAGALPLPKLLAVPLWHCTVPANKCADEFSVCSTAIESLEGGVLRHCQIRDE